MLKLQKCLVMSDKSCIFDVGEQGRRRRRRCTATWRMDIKKRATLSGNTLSIRFSEYYNVFVIREGFEPSTRRLKACCSTY